MSNRTQLRFQEQLPPDLMATLDRVADAAPKHGAAAWWAYEDAKEVIDLAVGWSSPLKSSRLYEMAIAHYCRRAGL